MTYFNLFHLHTLSSLPVGQASALPSSHLDRNLQRHPRLLTPCLLPQTPKHQPHPMLLPSCHQPLLLSQTPAGLEAVCCRWTHLEGTVMSVWCCLVGIIFRFKMNEKMVLLKNYLVYMSQC